MIRGLLAAAVVLVVTGCGGIADDPASGLAFAPPESWTSIPGFFGVHVYASESADQFILLRSESPDTDIDREMLDGYDVRNPRAVVRHDVKICGSTPARDTRAVIYFRKLYSDMRIHLISTTVSGKKLAAAYIYRLDARPDPEADAAIHNLCPAKPTV